VRASAAIGQLLAGKYLALSAHASLGAALAGVQQGPLGVWGLVLSAAVVLVAVAIPIATFVRPRPASELALASATELYVAALAAALKVTRVERQRIPHIVRAVAEIRANGALAEVEADTLLGPPRHAKRILRNLNEAAYAAFMVSEWWEGTGSAGASTPLLAQIVAVAEAWSGLTSHGGPELSHEQALGELKTWAGTRYDPDVVTAAATIIRRERRLTTVPAFQPRLHRLRMSLDASSLAKLFFSGGFPRSDGGQSADLSSPSVPDDVGAAKPNPYSA
jgi:hypothetical protein